MNTSGIIDFVGSEVLIARWEAKAEELEACAEQQRSTMLGLLAQTLEKARAYRACIADLRRYDDARAQNATDNDQAHPQPGAEVVERNQRKQNE